MTFSRKAAAVSTQINLQRTGSLKNHKRPSVPASIPWTQHCPVYHLALDLLLRYPKFCSPLSNMSIPYLNCAIKTCPHTSHVPHLVCKKALKPCISFSYLNCLGCALVRLTPTDSIEVFLFSCIFGRIF